MQVLVLSLSDEVLVLPGHYGDDVVVRPDRAVGAKLGELRRKLAPLSYDENAFVSWATARVVPRPPNYEEIIRANMGRVDVPLAGSRRLESGPDRCSGIHMKRRK